LARGAEDQVKFAAAGLRTFHRKKALHTPPTDFNSSSFMMRHTSDSFKTYDFAQRQTTFRPTIMASMTPMDGATPRGTTPQDPILAHELRQAKQGDKHADCDLQSCSLF